MTDEGEWINVPGLGEIYVEPDYTETADRAYEESKEFRFVWISRAERDELDDMPAPGVAHRIVAMWDAGSSQADAKTVWTPEVLEDFKRMFNDAE